MEGLSLKFCGNFGELVCCSMSIWDCLSSEMCVKLEFVVFFWVGIWREIEG